MRHSVLVLFLSIVPGSQAATQRCDLVSQPGPSKCLDLSQLDRSTIRVPANTTRIPSGGLSVCGIPGSVIAPTDIVYVVDQTASMKPTVIQSEGKDTTGWYECGKTVTTLPGTIQFHGNSVAVADSTMTHATLLANCKVAGDPYTVRSSTIQSAIQTQAALAPVSYAATIQFGPTIWGKPTPMTSLANQSGIDSLLKSVPLGALSGTNYEAPLEWARILLYGGHSSTGVVPASPDRNKAVVIISDGRPSKGVWQNALKAVDTITQGGAKWTGDSASVPPVYSIYLGIDTVEGGILQKLSDTTGGTYHQIPPNQPDSLASVVKQIMGTLINTAKPDTFRVTNLTNGQTSFSKASVVDGNAYRMELDSLVALNPGSNTLALSMVEGTETIAATWTVLVADSGASSGGALDTLLTERCGVPSSLTLRPDQSGLAYATDAKDRNLLLTLHTVPDTNATLPLSLSTRISADGEALDLAVPAGTPKDSLGTFAGSIPWQGLVPAGSVPGDLVIRSGPGWDTAYARFQMPRDPRDTASAMLALRRAVAPTLAMTPSVEGPTGRVQVTVTDSNVDVETVFVTVRHRLGDTLVVALDSVGNGVYEGSFPFAQGVGPDPSDSVLELGPLGTLRDSLSGAYLSLSAQTLVLPPTYHLRFLDSLGQPHDSLGFELPIGGKAPVTVQVWLGSSPCPACVGSVDISPNDPGLQILSASGVQTGSVVLQAGQATVEAEGTSPVHSGGILFSVGALGASVSAHPVRVLPVAPDSVVYLDADGDGALDRAVLYLRTAWEPGNGEQLPWPDSTHFLPWPTATLSLSPDSLVATFDFPPQSPGTTKALTPLLAHWRFDTTWSWQAVPVVEHIAPVPTTAHYRFSYSGQTPDTLVVTFSEPVMASGGGSWVSVGRPGTDSLGISLRPISTGWLSDGSQVAWFLLDSTSGIRPGDSLRITAASTGALSDSAGNAPVRLAKWIPVEWGIPPPVLSVGVPHPVVKAGTVPVGEPPITLLVNDSLRGAWNAPEGPTPQGLDSRFGGVVVRLNRIPESLGMYVYDNLGVLVLNVDIANLAGLAASGVLQRDLRGDYVVWLAWDGKDANGRDASTGVYYFRVYGWIRENGQSFLLNQMKSHGFYRKVSN
jgi:hypothetical protein